MSSTVSRVLQICMRCTLRTTYTHKLIVYILFCEELSISLYKSTKRESNIKRKIHTKQKEGEEVHHSRINIETNFRSHLVDRR